MPVSMLRLFHGLARLGQRIGCVLLLVMVGASSVQSLTPSTLSLNPQLIPSDAICSTYVREALERVATACQGLGRNQACYGNDQIQVERQPEFTTIPFSFDKVGDITDLLALRRIETSAYDSLTDTWGIALVKAQVNLPDALPGQNVTFLLFGDSELDSAGPTMEVFNVRTAIGGILCDQIPQSALFIQSPNGQRVEMLINGVNVSLGSTARITAIQHDRMTISLLEGTVYVNAFNVERALVPGSQVEIPLGGEDGYTAVGAPSELQSYLVSTADEMPISLLERDFPTPDPYVAEEESGCTGNPGWAYTYTLRAGDTLSAVASWTGVTVHELATANCISNPGLVVEGQVLFVPAPVSPTERNNNSHPGNENGHGNGGNAANGAVCGNNICERGENHGLCRQDCSPGENGNGNAFGRIDNSDGSGDSLISTPEPQPITTTEAPQPTAPPPEPTTPPPPPTTDAPPPPTQESGGGIPTDTESGGSHGGGRGRGGRGG